jgi:hypothetical protein
MLSQNLPATWIAMLCIVGLLCAQLSGLHEHRHVDLSGAGAAHSVQLHFEDVGWHGGGTSDTHQHDAVADGFHAHLDIETKVVDDGLAKVMSIVLLGLLLAWILLPRMRTSGSLPRPSALPRARRRSLFDGPPPSQAPPHHRSPAS